MANCTNTPPLKVVFLEQFAVGGLFHYAHSLCNALAKRGLEVYLLTASDCELANSARSYRLLNRLSLWNPYAPNSQRQRGLVRRLEQVWKALRYTWALIISLLTIWYIKPDIVHTSEIKFPLDLLLFLLLHRFPIVHTCHNVQRFSEGSGGIIRTNKLWYHTQRLVYRRCNGIIFHATNNVSEFQRVFDYEPDLWTVIPHGEYDLFLPDEEVSQVESRRALGLEENGQFILFFGALRRYKGLDVLLEAMARLCQSAPGTQLVVAGAPLRDIDVEELYHQARRLNLEESIIWRVEYIPKEKVHLYFYACDVVALPYRKAYDSGVLKIAQALGRPAVVTNTGGLAEAVEKGKAGLIAPTGDPEKLAQALTSLLTDTTLAQKLARRGQVLAHTTFGWESVAELTNRFYDRVIKSLCES